MAADQSTVTAAQRLRSSFRDPSGFVFRQEGRVLRAITCEYASTYDTLLESGLYGELTAAGLLIPHTEVPQHSAPADNLHRVVEPEQIPFVSYPYEWCFSQLKDAALLTLQVQETALRYGMTLKDASAYNVQFVSGRPVFIDTLSFDVHQPGSPWVAYRQFCQHFLAPLLLMSQVDVRLGRLLQTHIDGVPIDLASRLLPRGSWLRGGSLLHVHLHARSLKKHAGTRLREQRVPKISHAAEQGLLQSLRSTIERLRWRPAGTEWADYEKSNSYDREAADGKVRIVAELIQSRAPFTGSIWDLGANTGRFSRVAASVAANVVAFDVDPAAVEQNYLRQKQEGGGPILPLVLDLTNPSPSLGWGNAERDDWSSRDRPELVLALALVHHLAISHNVPLHWIAELLAGLTPALVIEFVPKADSQVQRLLGSREDVFSNYDEAGFEAAFSRYFSIERRHAVPSSERTLYLMERIA